MGEPDTQRPHTAKATSKANDAEQNRTERDTRKKNELVDAPTKNRRFNAMCYTFIPRPFRVYA